MIPQVSMESHPRGGLPVYMTEMKALEVSKVWKSLTIPCGPGVLQAEAAVHDSLQPQSCDTKTSGSHGPQTPSLLTFTYPLACPSSEDVESQSHEVHVAVSHTCIAERELQLRSLTAFFPLRP